MTQSEITFRVIKGDITGLKVDAIVNATDKEYSGGGGVDKSIQDNGGINLKEKLNISQKINISEAIITKGYNLPAKNIIHTIGPTYINGKQGEAALLEAAYQNCMRLADENGLKQIAFPAISTGAFSYPIEQATNIALKSVIKYLSRGSKIKEIIFVCIDNKLHDLYLKKLSNFNF